MVSFARSHTKDTKKSFRKPVSKRGVIIHPPSKGKGSYKRRDKHVEDWDDSKGD